MKNELNTKYEAIVDEYTQAFCMNYNLEPYDRRMWLAGGIGTFASISDYIINFNEIRYCIDNNLPWDDFESWYEACEIITHVNELLDEHGSSTRLSRPPLSVWSEDLRHSIEDNIKQWSNHIRQLDVMAENFIKEIEDYVSTSSYF